MLEVLFKVPVSISNVLLSSWIDIGGLVRLRRTVERCPEKKQQLSDLICSKCFVFEDEVDASNSHLIDWINIHDMKVSSILFSEACADESAISKTIWAFCPVHRYSGLSNRPDSVQNSRLLQESHEVGLFGHGH